MPTKDHIAFVSHGKRRLVAGLLWKPLRSARTYLAEARTLGKADGMFAYVLQHGRVTIQAGYAPKQPGVRDAYALAPVLVSVLGAEWVAAFDIGGERYALIAAHAGAILPGFDLVGDFEQTRAALEEALGLLSAEPDFEQSGKVIAPAAFHIGEDDHRTLSEVLERATFAPGAKLKPLSFGLTLGDAAIAAAVIIAVGGGVFGYNAWSAKKLREAQLAAAQEVAEQSAKAQDAAVGAAIETPKPWISEPSAGAVLSACQEHLRGVPLSIAGWRISRFDCGAQVGASYQRGENGATLLVFRVAAERMGADGWLVAVNPGGDDASITRPVPDRVPESSDVLPMAEKIKDSAVDYNQRMGGYAKLELVDRPPPPVPEGEDPPPPPPWLTLDVSISGKLPPFTVLNSEAIGDLSGLRISGISAQIDPHGAMTWTTKGVWYATR